ncbi:MAG: hypothetical protein ABJG68_03195 [Crocinitomicaceae bacterium]
MIGHLSKIALVLLVLNSCGNPTEDPIQEEVEVLEEPVQEKEPVDASRFIDFALVGEHEVVEEEVNVYYVMINDEPNEILKYEGKLVDASKLSDGYLLYFEPYSFWDDNLEMQIESQTNFKLTCVVSKKQVDYLGYFEDAPATNDIKWDYFENLFTLYYYLDEHQENIPLKFEDEGKTEWDG